MRVTETHTSLADRVGFAEVSEGYLGTCEDNNGREHVVFRSRCTGLAYCQCGADFCPAAQLLDDNS